MSIPRAERKRREVQVSPESVPLSKQKMIHRDHNIPNSGMHQRITHHGKNVASSKDRKPLGYNALAKADE